MLGEQADDAADLIEAAGFRVRGREQKVDTPRGRRRRARAEPAVGREARRGLARDDHVGRFEPENLDPDPGATPTPTP